MIRLKIYNRNSNPGPRPGLALLHFTTAQLPGGRKTHTASLYPQDCPGTNRLTGCRHQIDAYSPGAVIFYNNYSRWLLSIQAVFEWTFSLWVSRSRVASSPASSHAGSTFLAVLMIVSLSSASLLTISSASG